MKAEYLIGLECLAFLLGYFIRDIGSLGAASPPPQEGIAAPPAAPRNSRKPW